MGKIILQIVVALTIWFGLSLLNLHWGIRLGAILGGAVLVHFVWEFFFRDPFLYLGAMPIDPNDPLMLQAVDRAKMTFPKFLEVFPNHKSDSTVRFRFETDTGTVENLWGDLLDFNDESATVFLRTPPIDHNGDLDRTMTIKRDQINDWQVEFRDGTLRGGYTNVAMLKIYERENGPLHPQVLAHFERFKDVDW
jgi:uncharacterized protein YegJ (DUF2314 family)